MVRRASVAVCLTAVLALAFGAAFPTAAPVRLARHPDYHGGKVVFSYLGDIWMANEDGSNVHRLTDNLAREVYPRFSPDGRSIAFSSNRYGNNDVYVIASTGGAPRRLTYHTGGDDVVGWTRDSASVIFRASRGDGAFPSVATLYQIAATGGQEQSLNLDWGYWGSFSPDGKSLVFNRHPATWSRRHYRGSYAADLWIADVAAKSYTKLLGDEQYNRYWPMWGADGSIYFVGDPLANEKGVIPGSLDVRKSVNNIYKIPVKGGQPTQVTRHTDGSLFWPSMSSDGKVIVYEDNFGIWKLDTASGKTSEIKLDIASDEKENEIAFETITNEVDTFDLSPSSRRAVISARGQIFTIATDRGDITRVAPDKMASRNQAPTWSGDGKLLAFVSDRSGRDEIWVSDPEGRAPKKITDLDNEKGALVWTPDSTALLYTAADKKLYSYNVADGKTAVVASSEVGRIGSVDVSPDSKWIAFSKQDRTLRSHVYIVPIAGGEERHVSDDSLLYSETNAIWTADGRYLVFTSSEGASSGIASQGGISTTMELWALSLRDQDRDPTNRDIDNEAQGLAAEAAARQNTGRGGGAAAAPPPEVRIDWNGLARRARQLSVPGTAIGGLTASPEGHSVALTASNAAAGGRGGAPDATAGMYIINVESGQLTRVPPAPQNAAAGAGRGGRGGGGGGFGGGGSSMAFARDGRTLYFRSGSGLFAAPINLAPAAGGAQTAAGGGRGGGPRRRCAADDRTGSQRHGAPGDLHRQHRSRSQGAALSGLQRGLAHHEESLLRSEDARRRLGGHEGRLRAAPRLPRGRRGAEHRHDDDDRSAQRVAHRRDRRWTGQRQPAAAADAPAWIRSGGGPVGLLQDHAHLQGRSRGSRLPEDQEGRLPHLGRRSRCQDNRQLLAVLHARRREQVPLHGERQARERRRVGRSPSRRWRAPRSAISSTRDGSTIAARWSRS